MVEELKPSTGFLAESSRIAGNLEPIGPFATVDVVTLVFREKSVFRESFYTQFCGFQIFKSLTS